MAKPNRRSPSSGRSRRRSVIERNFDAPRAATSERIARKPYLIEVNGRITHVVYPKRRNDGRDLELETADLYSAPNLARGLIASFVKSLRSNRPEKTISRKWLAMSDMTAAIGGVSPNVDFASLERRHLLAFRKYLDDGAGRGRGRSKVTRRTAFLAAQGLLKGTGLCDHIEWVKRPYVSAGGGSLRTAKRKASRPVPKTGETRKLLRAALAEIQATMTLRAAFLDANHPAHSDPKTANRIKVAKALRIEFGLDVTNSRAITSRAKAVAGSDPDTWEALSAYLPTLRAMIPFCIILMIVLRLDAQMLTDLLQKNVGLKEPLGVKRLEATSWRSKVKEWKTTSASLSRHWHSPEKLIAFIDEWSKDLRDLAPAEIGKRQFIHMPLGSKREAVSSMGRDVKLSRGIKQFCVRNGLQPITSSIPRKLAIDLADLLSGGDIAVRSQIGGNGPRVNLEHYDTEDAVGRGDDAYGLGTMLLASHRLDHGRSPDRRTYMPDEDVMAATPGWWCSHPFDPPPGSGQTPSRPCAAYGWCPVCPHGEPDLNDPVSCKRVDLLLAAILASEPNMSPDLWEGTWKPVADEIAFKYQPMFLENPEVVAQAALLDIGPMMEVASAQDL